MSPLVVDVPQPFNRQHQVSWRPGQADQGKAQDRGQSKSDVFFRYFPMVCTSEMSHCPSQVVDVLVGERYKLVLVDTGAV